MSTIHEYDGFDGEEATKAAEVLHEAVEGWGTCEDSIISCLIKYSCKQRQDIADAYKQSYGASLADDLRDDLGGNFEELIIAMLTPPRVFDSRQLNKAVSGAGTDETPLIEILCSRSNEELEEIKEEYAKEFGSLEDDLASDAGGNFGRMLVSLSTGSREDSYSVDFDRATADAQELHEAGVEAWGTEESVFNKILCRNSLNQLKVTFNEYASVHEMTIAEVIDSEMSGPLHDGFMAIVDLVSDRHAFFAERIRRSMAGAGTEDNDLIRLIVSRSEIDLEDIKEAYLSLPENPDGKSIADAISDDTGGDYKNMLIAIVNGNK